MKRIPLLLLLVMAAIFLWTVQRPEAWAGWVQAFAEAGMVGALADWFAVVALFRHPLGIPIPHTAIIPRRKDEIGGNLATFVADHFLHPDVVRGKMESANLARGAADWLQAPAGRARVAGWASELLNWAAGAWREEEVRQFLRRFSRQQIEQIDFAPLLGRALDALVQGGRHEQLLTQALRYSVILLHDHRETIRGNVQKESPWWMPGFVDDRIVKQMLDRIEGLLLQMSLDPDHPMRQDFNRAVLNWSVELQGSPALRRAAERLRQAVLDNEALQEYLYRLWTDLFAGIEADLRKPDSQIREQIGRWVGALGREMARDPGMQAVVNRWVVDLAVALVEDYRHDMASLISDTVRRWDPAEASERVELAIGRDLQFIRVNGTLVGGLVGVLIHALTPWIR